MVRKRCQSNSGNAIGVIGRAVLFPWLLTNVTPWSIQTYRSSFPDERRLAETQLKWQTRPRRVLWSQSAQKSTSSASFRCSPFGRAVMDWNDECTCGLKFCWSSLEALIDERYSRKFKLARSSDGRCCHALTLSWWCLWPRACQRWHELLWCQLEGFATVCDRQWCSRNNLRYLVAT